MARLAMNRPTPSITAAISTTGRAPMRSVSVPQTKPATPMTMKPMVMAPEMPARVQPVSSAIGCR